MKIIISLWGLFALISAQTLDINALRGAQMNSPMLGLGNSTVTRETQTLNIHLMDRPVNKSKYIVGPGDQFQVNIISSSEVSTLSLVVSPTGEILVPSAGVVEVYGLTLLESITAIKTAIQIWNKNAKIHITLSQIREFKIKVIGHLQKPGLYSATPVSRVSDLFEIVMEEEFQSQQLETPEASDVDQGFNTEKLTYPELSRRNILILRHQDTIQVDLAKFGATGEDQYNPFIHQEDILLIPLKQDFSSIYGGVKIPGQYEYVPNESLADLIQLSGGLRPDVDPNKIEITRFNTPTDKFTFLTTIDESPTIMIEPEDHIMIRYEQDFKRQDIVYITGEIHFPGVYTIDQTSTLGQILKKAGGYTRKAEPSKLMINNFSINKLSDREEKRILLIPEENRAFSERAYIKARALTTKGTIESNSLEQTKSLMEFQLVNNDEIYVPENFNYIEVLGGVFKPGRYPFSHEKSYQDYIMLAGGKTKNATRNIFIIKAGTGQRLSAKNNVEIENGDTIFISDKIEFNKWIILKDVLSTLGQVATLILVLQNVIGN
ncbi:MAG: hypothetical protein HN674_00830 [Candidatus Marinimicrobia bacterium]|jgi:protein involved in polysaccharide export with SLBB domain|nr:hypothetical protein [Candidatus Neomarinimicrobiota bacterium]MBT3501878.1 hypothetical protein [Candidatus Neomarinimicrobiota bacterium]MBT3838596.1 hypothetical protein [Candidatus Neomarinimicrobiota bacterium]MBT3999790.1 hypothetical protein [Candidatus Neomarinimicrobiota bacterium]MBT4281845.1 hypothetical protein [Candidatus Neomarinimicrobiota bacterium]